MREKRRKFSAEFKSEAVRMVVETSRPIAEVAREIAARMWPATSSSATIPSDFTRRWATEPPGKPTTSTRICGKRPDNTNSCYPKNAGRPTGEPDAVKAARPVWSGGKTVRSYLSLRGCW